MRVLPFLLLAGCLGGGATEEFVFRPAQVSAIEEDFGPLIYVYATELTPSAIGYGHPPRSLYLTLSVENGHQTLEEHVTHALPAHVGTLRMTEHQQQPRLYIVERGDATVAATANGWLLSLDVTMIDPLDSARVHVSSTFAAPRSGIN